MHVIWLKFLPYLQVNASKKGNYIIWFSCLHKSYFLEAFYVIIVTK